MKVQILSVPENHIEKASGIPSFSQNTAPVYKKEVDDDITQSVQYMKQGGTIIPKYQAGKSTYNDRQRFWEQQGQLMLYPEIQWNGTQHANNGLFDKASEIEFKKRNPWFFAKYPNADMRNPNDVKLFQSEYDKMYADEFNGEHYFEGQNDMGIDGKFGNHTFNAPAFLHKSYATANSWNDFNDSNNVGDHLDPNSPTINRKLLSYTPPNQSSSNNIKINDTYDFLGKYGDMARKRQNPQEPNTPLSNKGLNANSIGQTYTNQFKPVGFTPWQNFNMFLPLLNKASIKSQYPLYQQQRSVAPEQTLQSADPYLNQIGVDYNQAANMNRALSPIQAYASNSELYGKKLDANNQAISAVNQSNAQIQNQQNQLAAQTYNTDMMNNLKFNKQYYDELSTTEQNKQRYKDFYNNQFMTNANQMIAENQAFNNILGSQKTYDGKPLYTPVSNGFGYSMQLTPGLNPDILFDQQFGSQAESRDFYNNLMQSLQSSTPGTKEYNDAIKNILYYRNMMRPKGKKGGFIPKFKL